MEIPRRSFVMSVAGTTALLSGCVNAFGEMDSSGTPSGSPPIGERRSLSDQHATTVTRAETAERIVYRTDDDTTELSSETGEQFLLVEVRISIRDTDEDRLIDMPNASAFVAFLDDERISPEPSPESTNDIIEPIEGSHLSKTTTSSGRPRSASTEWLVFRIPADSAVDEIELQARVGENDPVTWPLST